MTARARLRLADAATGVEVWVVSCGDPDCGATCEHASTAPPDACGACGSGMILVARRGGWLIFDRRPAEEGATGA